MGIRIGIVGAGTTVAIADRHVEGFLAQEGRCTVAAVCSRTLEGCRRLCIRHGLDGVRMTTRLEEIARQRIDEFTTTLKKYIL